MLDSPHGVRLLAEVGQDRFVQSMGFHAMLRRRRNSSCLGRVAHEAAFDQRRAVIVVLRST